MRSFVALQLFDDFIIFHFLTVNAAGVHGVIGIRHTDNPPDNGNIFSYHTVRIAFAVVALMVIQYAVAYIRKRGQVLYHLRTLDRIQFDDVELFFGQFGRLF